MLPYYFEDARDEKGTKKDNRYLFEGLKINGEGGTGRSDLFIKTVTRRKTAFVIEFKVAGKFQEPDRKAEGALRQIADRQYVRDVICCEL